MGTPTQPLRAEHAELRPHIERIRTVADAVGDVSMATLWEQIDGLNDFLVHHLLPHAEAEERVLYPAVAQAMGAPNATATMTRDHAAIMELIHELGAVRTAMLGEPFGDEQAKALRRVLYGLYALITVHFAKEEEIYLALLDARLGPDEAASLFTAMEGAASAAKQRMAHSS